MSIDERLRAIIREIQSAGIGWHDARDAFEAKFFDEALKATRRGHVDNIRAAARRVGVHRNLFYQKLQKRTR